MGASDRREAIMRILYRRGNETIANLANEFGVSERTIRRDIIELSINYPIFTVRGRYYGGIHIVDGSSGRQRIFVGRNLETITAVLDYISDNPIDGVGDDDIKALRQLIEKYS